MKPCFPRRFPPAPSHQHITSEEVHAWVEQVAQKYPKHHRHRPGNLFLRLLSVFGLIFLLVLGGMGALAYLLTRLAGGDGHTAVLVWLVSLGFALALPLLALTLAGRVFRGFAIPLADIMTVADAVAGGDLSARVSTHHGPGEFKRLAESFNRMIEELERTEQHRRNLTADVAHELRTPLHIIQGNLEGILDGVYTPNAEHLNATLEETHLLARLVDDLQTLSLAESGQLPLSFEPVDLAELLADVKTSFSGQAETAGLTFTAQTDPSLTAGVVRGDVRRLSQALNNLVANAIRHTPPGGSITLTASAEPGGARLTVADTGEGISPADLPYIFDRFWRGDRSRSHAYNPGSGLGLAITRQLIQAHGGQITAQSQPGQGSIFTITLPRE